MLLILHVHDGLVSVLMTSWCHGVILCMYISKISFVKVCGLCRNSNRWTRNNITDLVSRVFGNISSSTGSEDLLEVFTNNYHLIHVFSEPMVSRLIRSCPEALGDLCTRVMSSLSDSHWPCFLITRRFNIVVSSILHKFISMVTKLFLQRCDRDSLL